MQGVRYRRWFEKEAIQLNLMGYVRNLATGEVEAVLIGEQQAILSIIHHCYASLLDAQVENIQQVEIEVDSSSNVFKMIGDLF